jgi:hypothetical protein
MYIGFVVSFVIICLFMNIVDKIFPHVNWAAKTHYKYFLLINFLAIANLLILIIMTLKLATNFFIQ